VARIPNTAKGVSILVELIEMDEITSSRQLLSINNLTINIKQQYEPLHHIDHPDQYQRCRNRSNNNIARDRGKGR